MIITIGLCLSLIFLSGCSLHTAPLTDPCGWVREITFTQPTKEWLAAQDWPESATLDFKQIVIHNETVKALCQPEE